MSERPGRAQNRPRTTRPSIEKSPGTVKFQGFSDGGDKRDRTADLLNAMETISILLQFLYYSMYHLKIQNAA